MNSTPSGWLPANGAEISRSVYSNLFTAIGTLYGAGNGSTTFALPDLRGYFVRGAGTNSDATASGTFGAKQTDAFQGHQHTVGSGTGSGGYANFSSNSPQAIAASTTATVTDGTNGTPRTASETRPANIAMLYCIKF
jgi:microcystin-dependent protein